MCYTKLTRILLQFSCFIFKVALWNRSCCFPDYRKVFFRRRASIQNFLKIYVVKIPWNHFLRASIKEFTVYSKRSNAVDKKKLQCGNKIPYGFYKKINTQWTTIFIVYSWRSWFIVSTNRPFSLFFYSWARTCTEKDLHQMG